MACRRHAIVCVRIPDGCKQIGMDPYSKKPILKRVKTPFDFFITAGGVSACFDTKTVQEGNFPYSNIDYDQMVNLRQTERSVPSGYLIWFRKTDRVVFISAAQLYELRQGESFTPQDGVYIGNIGSLNPWRVLNLNTFKGRLEQLSLIEPSDCEETYGNNDAKDSG